MGNLCGVPAVNSHHDEAFPASPEAQKAHQSARAAGVPGQQQHCSEAVTGTTTAAPAASVGTQQSRTPQLHGQPGQPCAHHPSISSSTTTTTTTTRETRENEKGDGLMPLAKPAIHEEFPLPRPHNHLSSMHEDSGPPQTVPLNWTKGKLIGAGAFGRVFQGLDDDTGQIVAVKQVTVTKEETLKGRVAEHVRALEAEVAVLQRLNHRNIVRYLGTERTEDTLNIFLEYVPGGSIASLIEKFGPLKTSVIRMYTQQILQGLEYLHHKRIMHRDIKGANILVDGRGTVKLADFGASKNIEQLATVGSSKSIRGTPFWMAPEVIKQTGHGRPSDIWSLACVVIEMATGKPPWSNCNTQVAAMYHIASTKEPPPLPEHLPPEAKDFLLQCFNRVPKARPNATKLLRHAWMTGDSTQGGVKKALPMPPPPQPVPGASGTQQGPPKNRDAPADADAELLEGVGSNTGLHGLPPLVPEHARSSAPPPPQPQQQPQQQPQRQAASPPRPAALAAPSTRGAPAPLPQPQPLFAGPSPPSHTAAPSQHQARPAAAGGPVAGSAPPTAPPPPGPPLPQPSDQALQQAAAARPQPPSALGAAAGHARAPGGATWVPQGRAAGGASGGALASGRGMHTLPGPSALVGLAQQRTAAPAPGAAATASPLKGAQLRGMPVPRPDASMFPQPRLHPPATPQQQQQQQQQPSHAQPPAQPHNLPRAALVSTDFNPMEEPCWGQDKPRRGAALHPMHSGDQGIVATTGPHLKQQQQQQQQSGRQAQNHAERDVCPVPPGMRLPANPATTAAANGSGAGAGAANTYRPRPVVAQTGPPLRYPASSQASAYEQVAFAQERDSMPVRDSKMQNWRDGLIKEMASKRQSHFRPPAGTPAAPMAK